MRHCVHSNRSGNPTYTSFFIVHEKWFINNTRIASNANWLTWNDSMPIIFVPFSSQTVVDHSTADYNYDWDYYSYEFHCINGRESRSFDNHFNFAHSESGITEFLWNTFVDSGLCWSYTLKNFMQYFSIVTPSKKSNHKIVIVDFVKLDRFASGQKWYSSSNSCSSHLILILLPVFLLGTWSTRSWIS